jgi:hypothetical protein
MKITMINFRLRLLRLRLLTILNLNVSRTTNTLPILGRPVNVMLLVALLSCTRCFHRFSQMTTINDYR